MPQDAPAAPAAPATAGASCATQSFRCRWRTDQLGAAWIDVSGDVDRAAAPALARILGDAHAAACLVVLDLRETTLVDAAAGRVIREAGARAQRHGHRLVVARSRDQPDVWSALADPPHTQTFSLDPREPSVQVLLQLAAGA